ncbi:DUF2569 domain-containing protein [Brenneria roseae subsp. americana]|uniref:DUF2569 domain-containing protein n=1 Tax=Brenneria roseae subsp. americana TaxID=1508507 RepID=A0A2U1TZK5_9GAMM|nr:DUF2569 domain-containing protein [Brenneria roseae]PWC14831.1 DUF2569 domain-containing protein [Brenneria roseae subsp. americana]
MKCLNCDNDALKESGLCPECEKMEMRKINGILYLPALGLILSLILAPFSLFAIVRAMVIHFQQTGFIGYFGLFVVFCQFVSLLMAVFAALTFFSRKKGTRNIMIAYYSINFVVICCMTLLPAHLFNMALDRNDIAALISAIIGVVGWIPYFIFSKRVPVVFSK